MKYLLDVNVLLGFGFSPHSFHPQVERWFQSLNRPQLATCAITELGFVRILSQLPEHDITVHSAREMLGRWKASSRASITFLSDHLGVDELPEWVRRPSQTTDGHLVALAKAHGAVLATFDRKIHGAYLIPV